MIYLGRPLLKLALVRAFSRHATEGAVALGPEAEVRRRFIEHKERSFGEECLREVAGVRRWAQELPAEMFSSP